MAEISLSRGTTKCDGGVIDVCDVVAGKGNNIMDMCKMRLQQLHLT